MPVTRAESRPYVSRTAVITTCLQPLYFLAHFQWPSPTVSDLQYYIGRYLIYFSWLNSGPRVPSQSVPVENSMGQLSFPPED